SMFAGTGVGCGAGTAGVGVGAGLVVDGREVVPRRGDCARTAFSATQLAMVTRKIRVVIIQSIFLTGAPLCVSTVALNPIKGPIIFESGMFGKISGTRPIQVQALACADGSLRAGL